MSTQMAVPVASAQQRKGAKEVLTPKEDFLQYDRFKWRTADIPYDPNHSYSIGRLARTVLDEYSKLLQCRRIHGYIDHKGNYGEVSYIDLDEVPSWIVEAYFSTPRADTCPCISRDGKVIRAMYPWDLEYYFEYAFFGGAHYWD